jgi:tetratricopeptide (TPR) repeat protein
MLSKVVVRSIIIFAILVVAAPGHGQAEHPLPRPQARTEEEFDLYMEFAEASDPEPKHATAIRFEQSYPKSELLVKVYESELDYARSRERLHDAIAAGEKALRLEPADLKVLVDLAEILPSGAAEPLRLSKAEEYARKALLELKQMPFSHDVPVSACEETRNALLSRAHAALGYVFGKQGKLDEAIKELEAALALNPEPPGSQLLLAGKLYRLANRNQDAMRMFHRAASAGPGVITSLANSELNKISQEPQSRMP